MTPASQELDFHENFGDAMSDVRVLHPLRLSWLAGYRRIDFANPLFAGLVHAHHGIIGIIWQMINIQNFLQRRYEGRAAL